MGFRGSVATCGVKVYYRCPVRNKTASGRSQVTSVHLEETLTSPLILASSVTSIFLDDLIKVALQDNCYDGASAVLHCIVFLSRRFHQRSRKNNER